MKHLTCLWHNNVYLHERKIVVSREIVSVEEKFKLKFLFARRDLCTINVRSSSKGEAFKLLFREFLFALYNFVDYIKCSPHSVCGCGLACSLGDVDLHFFTLKAC